MNRTLRIGEIELSFVSGGQLRIDGGNMFGVVPRTLWQSKSPPDERNRIQLDTNCALVRTTNSLGLIDTGYSGHLPPKFRENYALEEGAPLARNLAVAGVDPNDIDWVILTHLHFDHVGGVTLRDEDGRLHPTFPRARHYIQRIEWTDAVANLPELAGAYNLADLAPLEQAGLVDLIDGAVEIAPGVATQLTGGHTRGHQMVSLQSAGQSAVCLGDSCPTIAHLPTFWSMAYDQFPLTVRRIKPAILADIASEDRVALFSHDPHVLAARLSRGADQEWCATTVLGNRDS